MSENTALGRRRATASKRAFPFEVVIEGPGFRESDKYASEEDAYEEARRVRDERGRAETVAFHTKFGHTGRYRVGRVQILRWNPLTRLWASHAQDWSRSRPRPNALTPLPRDWHDGPLPADWYADPADGVG